MIVNKYNQGGGGSGSGVTPQEVQQQINSALTPYWDSAVTESAITAVENHLYDVEEVTASALTELHDAVLELSGNTEEIELPIAAAVNELKNSLEARLDQQYYKKQDVLNLIQDKVTAGQVSEQVADIITPLFEAVYAEIEDKELAISAALNDLNDKKVASETVRVIWSGSQNEYDALTNSGATADSHTQYVIL